MEILWKIGWVLSQFSTVFHSIPFWLSPFHFGWLLLWPVDGPLGLSICPNSRFNSYVCLQYMKTCFLFTRFTGTHVTFPSAETQHVTCPAPEHSWSVFGPFQGKSGIAGLNLPTKPAARNLPNHSGQEPTYQEPSLGFRQKWSRTPKLKFDSRTSALRHLYSS